MAALFFTVTHNTDFKSVLMDTGQYASIKADMEDTNELHKQPFNMLYQNKPQPDQPPKPRNRHHHHPLYGREFIRRKMRRCVCAQNKAGLI